MKLVMQFTCGDGYTCSWTETLPFEYESEERALVDLHDLINEYENEDFYFAGHKFNRSTFDDGSFGWDKPFNSACLPNIMTLEKWFEENKTGY